MGLPGLRSPLWLCIQDLQDLSPILSSEPALRPEDPIYVRGEVQPLWEGQLLGNTWAATEKCSASVSLWGEAWRGLWSHSMAVASAPCPPEAAVASSSSQRWWRMLRKRALLSTSYQPQDGQGVRWLLSCPPRASKRENPGCRIKSAEGLAGMTRQPVAARTQTSRSCLKFNCVQRME